MRLSLAFLKKFITMTGHAWNLLNGVNCFRPSTQSSYSEEAEQKNRPSLANSLLLVSSRKVKPYLEVKQ